MAYLLSIVGSVAVTWFFTWLYYRKQAEDMEKAQQELLARIGTMFQVEDARSLSLDEMEEVILERGFPTEFGVVPYDCPECGAETETVGGVDTDPYHGEEYRWMTVSCTDPNCDWTRNM